MACSHASDVATLLKGAHTDSSPVAIRSVMMAKTNVLDNTLNPIQDSRYDFEPATPLAMGSGHVDPQQGA